MRPSRLYADFSVSAPYVRGAEVKTVSFARFYEKRRIMNDAAQSHFYEKICISGEARECFVCGMPGVKTPVFFVYISLPEYFFMGSASKSYPASSSRVMLAWQPSCIIRFDASSPSRCTTMTGLPEA